MTPGGANAPADQSPEYGDELSLSFGTAAPPFLQREPVPREPLIRESREDRSRDRVHFRIFLIFAMYAFAAALPLINLAGFDLREVDRELDRLERRRVLVAFDRPLEALEALRLRRLRPPLTEFFEGRHSAHGSTRLDIGVSHSGFTGGRLCKSSRA